MKVTSRIRTIGSAALVAGSVALLASAAPAAERERGRLEPGSGLRPAAQPAPTAVPREVLVAFRTAASPSQRAAARRDARVTVERQLELPGRVQLVRAEAGQRRRAAIRALERSAHVRYAEPNWIRQRAATMPDDPLFGDLWGLRDIGAPEAWDRTTGSGDVVVAVVDEGIAYDHPDLAPNMWSGPGGVHGRDFVDEDDDPRDVGGHGTHVAGTIAAQGDNGIDVTGVAWDAQLMALRALGPMGGTDADIAEAFQYAADNGASIVNASLGGPGPVGQALTLRTPVTANPDVLFVVAAGNDGADNDAADGDGAVPCNFPDANLICVAATDSAGLLAPFSNFGTTSVDLAAPGVGVLSAAPDRGREIFADDFEGDDFTTVWQPTDIKPGSVAWSRSSRDGGHVAEDSAGVDYAADGWSYLDFKTPLALSSGDQGCVVRFDAVLDFAPGDWFLVFASTDGGGEWTFLGGADGASTGGEFMRDIELPLHADGAGDVILSFGIEADDDARTGDGATVDNVRIGCVRPESADDGSAVTSLDGTSMAAPHVAGAAALLHAAHPGLTVPEARALLLGSGDPLASLAGKTVTGRRLDAAGMFRPQPTTGPATEVTPTAATMSGRVDARRDATQYRFDYGTTAAYGSSTAPAPAGAGVGAVPVSARVAGLAPSTTYHYRLVALRGSESFPGVRRTFTTPAGAPPPVTPEPTATPTPTPTPVTRSFRGTARKGKRKARVACTSGADGTSCRVTYRRARRKKVAVRLVRAGTVLAKGRVRRANRKGRVRLRGTSALSPGRHRLKVRIAKRRPVKLRLRLAEL